MFVRLDLEGVKVFSRMLYAYTITGVSAEALTAPQAVDVYAAPKETVSEAGQEGAPVAPAVRKLAIQKLGFEGDTVRVHLNMEVLFFNPNKPIK